MSAKNSKLIKGSTGDWEVVIGMEIHAQVTTNAKLFSGASTEFGGEPNSHVSLVDAAMPGMLPVINEECVKQAVRTGLGMNNTGPMTIIIKLGQGFILPPDKGAKTSIYLASSPEVERVTGAYFANCKEVKPSAAALDDAVAERLWRVSAELTALKG